MKKKNLQTVANQRTNCCLYNTDATEDIDCSTEGKINNDKMDKCGEDGCTVDVCCKDIEGLCINNTDETKYQDINCTIKGEYNQNENDETVLINEENCRGRSCGIMKTPANIDIRRGKNKKHNVVIQ